MFRQLMNVTALIWVILALAACSSSNGEMFSSDSTSSSVLFGSMKCDDEQAKDTENQAEEPAYQKSGIHELTPEDQAINVDRLPFMGYMLSRGVSINQITVSPPVKLHPIEKARLFQSSASPMYRTYPVQPLEPSTIYEITATWGQCFEGEPEPVLSTKSWSFTTGGKLQEKDAGATELVAEDDADADTQAETEPKSDQSSK